MDWIAGIGCTVIFLSILVPVIIFRMLIKSMDAMDQDNDQK